MRQLDPISGAAAAGRAAADAFDDANPWIERLARFGYAAKGVVYVLVGGLAALGALRAGGRTTGARGALTTLLDEPLGSLALWIVAVGLFGYVLWRFVQAFKDPDRHGTDLKGLGLRGFFVVNGLIYLSLALGALALARGDGGGGGGDQYTEWTARVMSQPHGRLLVGLGGAVVVGVGLYQFYRAYTAKFRKRLKTREMGSTEDRWATRIGRFGFAARGVTFALIGMFLISAALHANPGEARGLDGALRALEEQPLGPWLLGIVAVGLVAYGVFQMVVAKYRRIGLA
ncbi:MAG: DUF1206 domain-containing protein [Gemmatimonadota bacterium]